MAKKRLLQAAIVLGSLVAGYGSSYTPSLYNSVVNSTTAAEAWLAAPVATGSNGEQFSRAQLLDQLLAERFKAEPQR